MNALDGDGRTALELTLVHVMPYDRARSWLFPDLTPAGASAGAALTKAASSGPVDLVSKALSDLQIEFQDGAG
jgi:hypothetical protein